MFVRFASASRDETPRQSTLIIPERGAFGIVDGDAGAAALTVGALDAGLRTSTTAEDVAEVLDGIHAELRERRGEQASFALLLVEDDALAFFSLGSPRGFLFGPGFVRPLNSPALDRALGGDGEVRFFRAWVRAGDVAVLLSLGAWSGRDVDDVRELLAPDLEASARALVRGPGARDGAVAVVVRVDEDPRIR